MEAPLSRSPLKGWSNNNTSAYGRPSVIVGEEFECNWADARDKEGDVTMAFELLGGLVVWVSGVVKLGEGGFSDKCGDRGGPPTVPVVDRFPSNWGNSV